MKAIIWFLMFGALIAQNSQAQFSENFDQSVTNLSGNCWLVNQVDHTTSGSDVINGTGSAYTNPPTSSSGVRSISTPFLDVTSTSLSVSFNYKVSSKINGNSTRTIEIGLVDRNGVFTSLQLIILNKNSTTAVVFHSNTYNIAAAGTYRLELRIGGATGDGNSRVIFDDLNVNASAHYGPASHCNTPGVAVDDAVASGPIAAVSGNVLTNDQFPADNETYSPVLVAAPASGTLVLNTDGSFTYTPSAEFNGGVVTFTYQLIDNGFPPVLSNIATVTITYPTPVLLPVVLRDFTATLKGADVELKWIVDFNTDGKHYNIEKSTDGKNFTVIGTVQANDHSNKYSFVDKRFDANAYYRLRVFNTDGSKGISKTLLVKHGSHASAITILGTTVTSAVKFRYVAHVSGSTNIQLYAVNGVKVLDDKLNMITGTNEQSIDVQKLNPGMYVMTVYAGTQRQTVKFVKQ